MHDSLFSSQLFPVAGSTKSACVIVGIREKISGYKKVIKALNDKNYSVIAYQYSPTVITSGDPDRLLILIDQICADFAEQSAGYKELICVGASMGAAMCLTVQRRLPRIAFGVYAGAGVSPPEAVYSAPVFYFARKKFARRGYGKSDLKKAWSEIDILPGKTFTKTPFVIALGTKDRVISYEKALATLRAWQNQGQPIEIITKPNMGHIAVIRWYKNNFAELLAAAEQLRSDGQTTEKYYPQSLADDFRKQFWLDAARHLPHHAGLKAAQRIKSAKLVSYAYRGRQNHLTRINLKAYPDDAIAKYVAVCKNTALWHGTGRYQYSNQKVVDILQRIVSVGGLQPAADSYAVMLGGKAMVSISATPLRIIARCYADIHGKGIQEPNRFGSSLWWVSYYYGPFYAEIFTKNLVTIVRHYKKWHSATSDSSGERVWGKKVNQNARHVWDAFGLGSDIAGNYPIVFGIRAGLQSSEIPRIMAKVEVRLTDRIQFSDMTHLEVPENKIAETQKLLAAAGYTLPVFPIELGEYVASKQSMSELVGFTQPAHPNKR